PFHVYHALLFFYILFAYIQLQLVLFRKHLLLFVTLQYLLWYIKNSIRKKLMYIHYYPNYSLQNLINLSNINYRYNQCLYEIIEMRWSILELRQIKYFMEVAQREHVTEAANALHVAQSAVSRQIFNLEEELGVDLFIREGRTVKLTKIGEVFYEHMKQ